MDGLCPNCGSPVREGSKFCPKCGASLEVAQAAPVPPPSKEMNLCSHCGKELEPDTLFCPYCGQEVKPRKEAPAEAAASETMAGASVAPAAAPMPPKAAVGASKVEQIDWDGLLNYKTRLDKPSFTKLILICYGLSIGATILMHVLTDYPTLLHIVAAIIVGVLVWGHRHFQNPLFRNLGALMACLVAIIALLRRLHIIHTSSVDIIGTTVVLLLFLAILGLTVYHVILDVRRCHDLNHTGWLAVLSLLPFICIVFDIYLACTAGVRGPNQYGDDPLKS